MDSRARRLFYASSEWRHRSATARRRARGHCERCRAKSRRLEVHHLHALADGGDPLPDADGLIALCPTCHGAAHGRVSVQRRAWRDRIAAAIEREPEPAIIGGFF